MGDNADSLGRAAENHTAPAKSEKPSGANFVGPALDHSTVPSSFSDEPDQTELLALNFPKIVGPDGQELPVKDSSALGTPSKTLPERSTARTETTIRHRQEPKLTKIELDKAVVAISSIKPETVQAARLKIAEAIRGTNGADVIKDLGQMLGHRNPEISKAAAKLLSDTYWGSLPHAGVVEPKEVPYNSIGRLKNIDPRFDLFAHLSDPQVLQGELKKVAELKRIMADSSRFSRIKDNASASWLNIPEDAIPGPNRSSRMQAINNLTKTSDDLQQIKATLSDNFLSKNLPLFKRGDSVLDLGKLYVTDNDLKEIANQMPGANALFIGNGAGITDEGMKVLQDLPLRALHMNESEITDAGLATLARMPPLNSLYLGHTPGITNQGLVNLQGSRLQSLGFIHNPQITNDAIPALKNLVSRGNLAYLSLIDTGVTTQAMQTAGFDIGTTKITVSRNNGTDVWESRTTRPEMMEPKHP